MQIITKTEVLSVEKIILQKGETTIVHRTIKITIVGDSHLRFLKNYKIPNDHHTVNKGYTPGVKIKEKIRKNRNRK